MISFTGAIIVCLILILILATGVAFFFRHPHISDIGRHKSEIRSPAYGTIKRIERLDNDWHIIIFLSPFDIHRQYYPTPGIITAREHDKTGKFYLAFDLDKSSQNEKIITTMEMDAGGTLIMKQIAGWFARCVAAYNDIGSHVESGEPAGMIEFGSRVDVIFPARYKLVAEVGDYVHGPDTVLACSDSVC